MLCQMPMSMIGAVIQSKIHAPKYFNSAFCAIMLTLSLPWVHVCVYLRLSTVFAYSVQINEYNIILIFPQTDEQCNKFSANAIDDTGSVTGSVAMGVATRCTFTAWQITYAAPNLGPTVTVTGTLTTTHTDCGQQTTTSGNCTSTLKL